MDEERRGKEGGKGRRSEERIREGGLSEEEEGEGGDEGVNENSRGREESCLEARMKEEEGKRKGWKAVFGNIVGLRNKDEEFWKELGGWDIVIMIETWVDEGGWEKIKRKFPRGCKWRMQAARKKEQERKSDEGYDYRGKGRAEFGEGRGDGGGMCNRRDNARREEVEDSGGV